MAFDQEYLYASLDDLQSLIRYTLRGETFSDPSEMDNSLFNTDNGNDALDEGIGHLLAELYPLSPAPLSELNVSETLKDKILLQNLKTSHRYVSAIFLLDTIPPEATLAAAGNTIGGMNGQRNNQRTYRTIKKEYEERYIWLIKGLKSVLYYGNIDTPPHDPRFYIGHDFDFTGRSIDLNYPRINPRRVLGAGPRT